MMLGAMAEPENTELSAEELRKRLRSKNLALVAVLLGLVALFYVVTIVRVGAS